MPRSSTLIAAGVVAVLALSACGPDDPKPNYSSVSAPPSSSTPTPSETSSAPNTTANVPSGVAPPTLPSSGTSNTPEGALAFAGYFWRMLDWAYATNNAAAIDGLFATTCKSCETFRSSIATDVGAGYTLLGGRISIKTIQATSLEGGRVAADLAFDVALTVDALQEKGTDGSVATSYPASSSTQRTYVAWQNEKWTVVNTAQVKT